MSEKHPIISIAGSSGAGTTAIRQTFEQIFRREDVNAAFIEGDAFHRYDRDAMDQATEEAARKGNFNLTHFGEDANLLEELEATFASYADTGTGKTRHYAHDDHVAKQYGIPVGAFTEWEDLPKGTDLLFYEGLHGAVITDKVNIAQYADLKIGVVPVINLEWIQKIHRDKDERGYSTEDVTQIILRRMPEYVKYICPQFSQTDINFQRVPMVDTSNPFIARSIPTPEESMVVIRFQNPRGIDFAYLKSMMQGSFMSRANSIVVPGGKMDLAMQLIFTPMILKIVERKRRFYPWG